MPRFWKEEECLNLTRQPVYVVGKYDDRKDKTRLRNRSAPKVLVSYTPTAKGYAQRCTHPDAQSLNNDYVSNESMKDLKEWFMVDFGGWFEVFDSPQEAEANLGQRDLRI